MSNRLPLTGIFNPFEQEIVEIHGPYWVKYKRGKLKRRSIMIKLSDGSRTSMLYSRWLMTQKLRRHLETDEQVDHIDDDPQHDVIDNLQLLSPSENARKALLGKPNPTKGIERGWEHGTQYGWMKKKCLCTECEKEKWRWHTERNSKRRSLSESGDRGAYQKAAHGTITMYRYGCKCEPCRVAHRDAARKTREKARERKGIVA